MADDRAAVGQSVETGYTRLDIFLAHYYDVPHRACTGCDLRDVSQVEHAEHVLGLLDHLASVLDTAHALDAAAADVARLAKGLRHGARHLRETRGQSHA